MSSKSEKLKRVDEEIAKLESQLYVGGSWLSDTNTKVKKFQNDSLQPALRALASRAYGRIKSTLVTEYKYTDDALSKTLRHLPDYSTNETKPNAVFSFTIFRQLRTKKETLLRTLKNVLVYFYVRTGKSSLCTFVDKQKPINFKEAFGKADYISKNFNVFALALEWYTTEFDQIDDESNRGGWNSGD